MKVTEITVSAGRVIPHPRESYANLRPMLSLKASIDDGEGVKAATELLQAVAEDLLAAHVAKLTDIVEAEYQAERKRQDEAYERRQRERSLASVADADALDDDEIDDNEDITSDDIDAMDEEDEEIPFETPGR